MAKKLFSRLFPAPAAGSVMEGRVLSYDWRLDGRAAEFGVDLHLSGRAPMQSHTVLALVSCSGENGESILAPAVLKKAISFIKKSAKELNAVVAGYIETDLILQYYIYLPSTDAYERMKALAAERKGANGLAVTVGGRTEPDWKSYFEVLLPDEAKSETIRNGDVIKALYKNGDSEAPRRINLHLAFPTDAAREAFASDALAEGFATGDLLDGSEAHEDCPCEIAVHRICAMKKWDVDAVTVHAIRLAEEHGGVFLYWDCPIVPRKL